MLLHKVVYKNSTRETCASLQLVTSQLSRQSFGDFMDVLFPHQGSLDIHVPTKKAEMFDWSDISKLSDEVPTSSNNVQMSEKGHWHSGDLLLWVNTAGLSCCTKKCAVGNIKLGWISYELLPTPVEVIAIVSCPRLCI